MPPGDEGFGGRGAETRTAARHLSGMMNNHLTTAQAVTSWILQLAAAVILLQTLFFKFSGAEESVYIFTTLGMEPWGRIGSGVAELAASILLLIPATAPLGALLAMSLMAGAIASHLTVLGIEIQGDGGLLFALAVAVLVSAAVILAIRRAQIPVLGRYLELA